jgi:L-asparagine transporter-like permease
MAHHHGLTAWQLTMMTLGTVVGGSFFLGSAIAVRTAGPGIIISYLLGGLLVYIILSALSEMTVAHPVSGSFRTYAQEAFGPGVGFVLGWVYWTGLILAMSSEAIAAAVLIKTWLPGVPLTGAAIAIIIGVTLLNLTSPTQLSTLESWLAAIKISAILGFIIIAFALITGLFPGRQGIGLGFVEQEPFFRGGLGGIAGSMLIVMFTYAGFEVIGLAAPDVLDTGHTVRRAIVYTILGLVGLYTLAITCLLPLVPTNELTAEISPFVVGLAAAGQSWVAGIINLVLIIAILSTMLAALYGLGRMVRSLAEEGYAPVWLKEDETPKRGLLFSGAAMFAGVGAARILPGRFYLFLVSSGGFALLFSYLIILTTHFKFRHRYGCPPDGHCQLRWFPALSVVGIGALVVIILSMPVIPGQGSGLLAGLVLVAFYSAVYLIYKRFSIQKTGLG